MAAAVEIDRLFHAYPAKRNQPERRALNGVSFTVQEGEIFGVLGPNGGGKSTLFKILSTLFAPQNGSVRIMGRCLPKESPAIRGLIGVVFQNPSLDNKLTVVENMRHQGRLYGLSGADLERRIGQALRRYDLKERENELCGTLSGGLRRRVELAKALVHGPQVLFMDEPTNGLDPAARKEFWDHLKELQAQHPMTVLVTTHLMDEAERCARLVLLDKGHVAAQGTPTELKSGIGGDVITIEAEDAAVLRTKLKEMFKLDAALVGGALRLEKNRGHAFIPELIEAFPGLVRSVSLSKPSLEEAFIHHTGRRLS